MTDADKSPIKAQFPQRVIVNKRIMSFRLTIIVLALPSMQQAITMVFVAIAVVSNTQLATNDDPILCLRTTNG